MNATHAALRDLLFCIQLVAFMLAQVRISPILPTLSRKPQVPVHLLRAAQQVRPHDGRAG